MNREGTSETEYYGIRFNTLEIYDANVNMQLDNISCIRQKNKPPEPLPSLKNSRNMIKHVPAAYRRCYRLKVNFCIKVAAKQQFFHFLHGWLPRIRTGAGICNFIYRIVVKT